MGDYADFNRQYSLTAQALVFDVIADLISDAGYPDCDYVKDARWCAVTLTHQYVYFQSERFTTRTRGVTR